MPDFIPGLELSRLFFREAVGPAIDAAFPRLQYGAALLGSGSEVLGFDTEMSTDHNWGPRVDLFLREDDFDRHRAELDGMLRDALPRVFHGHATSFTEPDPTDNGTQLPEFSDSGPIRHKIGILTPALFLRSYLAFDPAEELSAADWLTFPEQKLRTLTSGPIFRDDVGLEVLRNRFVYHPRDVWLYLLAAAWARLGQEEHLMGRAGMVGDEIGSAIIGARLVRDVMRLCFLMERTYAPYAKWFGTAFQRLKCSSAMSPILSRALSATTWQKRETHLVAAYEIVAAMHNQLGITDSLPVAARPFFSRPFQVIALHGFADAIVARIEDESVCEIAKRPLIGSIDQFSDSTDLVSNVEWRSVLRHLYS
jgi:hypothetical protein